MLEDPFEDVEWEDPSPGERAFQRAHHITDELVARDILKTDILNPTWSPRDLHISETLQAAVECWIALDFDATVHLVGRAEKYMTMPESQLPN